MAILPTEVQAHSDAALIEAVREGSTEAYAQLYERHSSAALNMARTVARSGPDADDLVAEAFARVLNLLRSGRGPTDAFRAYLLTTIRHTAYDRTRKSREQPAADVSEVPGADVAVSFPDPAVAGLERDLISRAFHRLPERWQAVLWHAVVEQQSPTDLAEMFGLTANGVSALVYRAREGLRQEYLQGHIGQLDTDGGPARCRSATKRLGAWVRGKLAKRETAQVESHLDHCDRCNAVASELVAINDTLRGTLAPVVLGVAATTGYLAAAAGSAATAGGAAGAAGAAGMSSGAGTTGNALTAGPRQTATAALSAGGFVTAVGIALSASGAQPPQPNATPPPPPAAEQPPAPPPPPQQPPPEQPPPAPQSAAPQPAVPPPSPGLNATGPTEPVQLLPGGDPADLPITVRNEGTAPSKPVTVQLDLPDGVTAGLPGSTQHEPAATPASAALAPARGAADVREAAAPHGTQLAATSRTSGAATGATSVLAAPATAAPATSDGVRCTDSDGELRCELTRGLAPGDSFTFDFRVRADADATGGSIDARVTAGNEVNLKLPTTQVVITPPERTDGVSVRLTTWDHHLPWMDTRATVHVRNTGERTGNASTLLHLPPDVQATGFSAQCAPTDAERVVRCERELQPGESFTGQVWLHAPFALPHPVPYWGAHPSDPNEQPNDELDESPPLMRSVPVKADVRLGAAEDRDVSSVQLWAPWLPPHAHPQQPTPPSEPSEPSTPPTTTSVAPNPPSTPDLPGPSHTPPTNTGDPGETEGPEPPETGESTEPSTPTTTDQPSETATPSGVAPSETPSAPSETSATSEPEQPSRAAEPSETEESTEPSESTATGQPSETPSTPSATSSEPAETPSELAETQ